jgi:hypothetical protein
MIQAIKKLLAHPATRGLSLDDPLTTQQRRDVIQGNRFLWRILPEATFDFWHKPETVFARGPIIGRCSP